MASTYGDVSNSANGRSTPDPAGLADQIAQLKLDSSPGIKPQTPSQASIKAGAAATAPSSTTPSRGLSSSPVTVRLQVAAALTPPKATVLSDEKTSRERPHSYTGGLSTADLRKLQMGTFNNEPDPSASRGATPITARPMNQLPSFNSEDAPPVSSLSSSTNGRPGSSSSQPAPGFPLQEDAESEFTIQQQAFHPPQPQPLPAGALRINQSPGLGSFPRGGAHGLGTPFNSQRSFSPAIQGGMPMQSPPPTFTGFAQQGIPLSMYDMMSAGAVDPSPARVPQQHGTGPNFRQGHGHNSNDLTVNVMPDARTLALMQSMQGGFNGPAMYSPPPGALGHQVPPPSAGALGMYANGGMGAGAAGVPTYAQELYAQADGAFSAAARMQQQYLANYNPAIPQPPAAALNQLAAASVNLQAAAVAAVAAANATASAVGNTTNSGPSANNRKLGLYKTELCRSWEEKGTCRYGTKCQFAHGEDELRQVQRHPKYKTEVCRTFWVSGSCPYGKRCCFLHTEGTDGASPPPNLSGHSRSRSASTNSDSAESNSLLHRISRAQGVVATAATTSQVATPVDKPSTPTSAGYSRPGGLRLDTTSLGGVTALAKENKSAYPSFPQGPSALSQHTAPEPSSALSPLPMTAHPDFGGRHGSNLARLDVGVAAQARIGKAKAASPNNRHSFNGTDLGLDFSNVGPGSLATPVQTTGPSLGRSSGHMRSGSAGNWAALSRSSRLGNSPYSSIPSVDVNNNSPWAASNSELTSLT